MDDTVGWLLLALISAMVSAQFHLVPLLLSAAEVMLYLLGMIFIIRPLMVRWTRSVMQNSDIGLSSNALAQLIIFFMASAAVTHAIGIFSVFGAFVMGGILHDQKAFCAAVNNRMSDFVTVFFLPIFFTFTGLRTDIGSLSGTPALLVAVVVVLAATIGKFGGCSLAARLSGLSWHEAFTVGTMMNTRGLVELVVLNTGYDLGIIPKPIFFIFVLMAVATTYMTSPALRLLIRGTELEVDFNTSPFMQGRAIRSHVSTGSSSAD